MVPTRSAYTQVCRWRRARNGPSTCGSVTTTLGKCSTKTKRCHQSPLMRQPVQHRVALLKRYKRLVMVLTPLSMEKTRTYTEADAADNVISIQGESLRVLANRADVLWQRAVKTLKARDNHFPAVHLSYWDSYGNKPQPEPHPMGGRVPRFKTVERSVLNPLSDAG